MDTKFRYRVTVENPQEGRRISVTDDLYGLDFIYLDSKDVPELGTEWDTSGVYVIITGWALGIWAGYLGQSCHLKARQARHLSVRGSDAPVLMVRKSTAEGFTSADIALIERRLTLHLAVSDTALPVNDRLPEGAKAHRDDHRRADAVGESIRGVLTLLGYPVHSIDLDTSKTDAARIPWNPTAPDPNDDPIHAGGEDDGGDHYSGDGHGDELMQVEHLGATAHHFGGDGSVDDSAASVDPCWESEE